VHFHPERELRPSVAAALERHGAGIRAVLPDAAIEHIGATAVPGALTKGDLDLLVRVERPAFADAKAKLGSLYAINQPENWNQTFASFMELPKGEVPVGVQLVVADSADDRMLVSWRDQLLRNSELLDRYNRFKRGQVGADPDAYVEAKAKFIERILGGGVGESAGGE
jgi:GrpB-like predicted nucleotidyltransferase (UPF0157 family)